MLHHEKGATPPLFASGYCTPPSPSWSRKPARKSAFREGFTLLEMLVVVAVMALLMGVTFRMMQPSDRARKVANTIKTLNLVNAAIAEYHAEYGIYPPVTDPPLRRDGTGRKATIQKYGDSECGAIPGGAIAYWAPTVNSLANSKSILGTDDEMVFVFGLVSFLVDRCDPEMKGVDKDGKPQPYWGAYSFLDGIFGNASKIKYFGSNSRWAEFGRAWEWSEGDKIYDVLHATGKDANFYKRIRGITQKIIAKDQHNMNSSDKSRNYYCYTIKNEAVDNTHDLVYICPPPFTTYALFSAGPDDKVVTDDPLNPEAQCPTCKQYHNRDNIYSSVNAQ